MLHRNRQVNEEKTQLKIGGHDCFWDRGSKKAISVIAAHTTL